MIFAADILRRAAQILNDDHPGQAEPVRWSEMRDYLNPALTTLFRIRATLTVGEDGGYIGNARFDASVDVGAASVPLDDRYSEALAFLTARRSVELDYTDTANLQLADYYLRRATEEANK